MKAFFEEYGRTIVTVLIILGIILVGYTLAGNGKTSAFGRFTSDIVDSLSGQANSLLKDSPENIERSTEMQDASAENAYGASVTTSIKDGVTTVTVNGKAVPWGDIGDTAMETSTPLKTPWGKKSVMSFDIFSDANRTLTIDTNALVDGSSHNDNYSHPVYSSVDGSVGTSASSTTNLTLTASKWHHVIVILENGNEKMNPSHLPVTGANTVKFNQDSGTTHYQIKNLKYGNAD